MDRKNFRHWAHKAADWGASYLEDVKEFPVRAQVAPGEIAGMIGDTPPETGEDMGAIFADFERIVPRGMTP